MPSTLGIIFCRIHLKTVIRYVINGICYIKGTSWDTWWRWWRLLSLLFWSFIVVVSFSASVIYWSKSSDENMSLIEVTHSCFLVVRLFFPNFKRGKERESPSWGMECHTLFFDGIEKEEEGETLFSQETSLEAEQKLCVATQTEHITLDLPMKWSLCRLGIL